MNFALLLFSLLVITGAVSLADRLWLAGRHHDVTVDRCCFDFDGGGPTDDGVLVVARRGEEVRRIAVRNHGTRIREVDVTSYAEIILAVPVDDFAHPAFGKLFLETEYLADSAALLCHRRSRDPRAPGAWAPAGQKQW